MGAWQGIARAFNTYQDRKFAREAAQEERDWRTSEREAGEAAAMEQLRMRLGAERESLMAKMKQQRAGAQAGAEQMAADWEALKELMGGMNEDNMEWLNSHRFTAGKVLDGVSNQEEKLSRNLSPQEIQQGWGVLGNTGRISLDASVFSRPERGDIEEARNRFTTQLMRIADDRDNQELVTQFSIDPDNAYRKAIRLYGSEALDIMPNNYKTLIRDEVETFFQKDPDAEVSPPETTEVPTSKVGTGSSARRRGRGGRQEGTATTPTRKEDVDVPSVATESMSAEQIIAWKFPSGGYNEAQINTLEDVRNDPTATEEDIRVANILLNKHIEEFGDPFER